MPRRAIGDRPMTPTERSARRRVTQAEEIRLLRCALLDAITAFGIDNTTQFHRSYADLIARAAAAKLDHP